MNKLIVAGVVALTAASTAACGRMADLEAPAKRTERSLRSGSGPTLPEPATIYRPSSVQPIDGGPTSPYAGSGSTPGQR